MKIIYLNTWGGKLLEPLEQFLKKHHDVDVFCFQEIWNDAPSFVADKGEYPHLFTHLGTILNDYEKIFSPAEEGDSFGLAMYYHKSLLKISDDNFMIHNKKEYFPQGNVTAPKRNLQSITFQVEDYQKFTIINFLGLWNDQGKLDTEDRLLQSDAILNYLTTLKHSFILGGDFNLSPDTLSLKKFEDFGLRNLIREHNITSTRTSHYSKEGKFADYVFTSRGVNVEDFQVLPDEVSDHAPLYVKVSV